MEFCGGQGILRKKKKKAIESISQTKELWLKGTPHTHTKGKRGSHPASHAHSQGCRVQAVCQQGEPGEKWPRPQPCLPVHGPLVPLSLFWPLALVFH